MAKHRASDDISQDLASAFGQDFALNTWHAVAGGSIHQAWKVQSDCGQQFFIKTNHANKQHTFKAEALGLAELQRRLKPNNPIYTPRVHTYGHNKTHAWLVLSYIKFGQDNEISQSQLGQGLAMLHQQTAIQFGFSADNVIGENLQSNQNNDSWLDFFQQQRLGTQFELAKQHGFYHSIAHEAEQLLRVVPKLLQHHQPKASLLHGDLWAGNCATNHKGCPVIFDPAVYYGDRECDLAMTELFGCFSHAFYTAYENIYPLSQGYNQRKELYNLYHILNHANLFAGHYIQQSRSMMSRLIEQAKTL